MNDARSLIEHPMLNLIRNLDYVVLLCKDTALTLTHT